MRLHKELEGKEFWYDDIILVLNELPDFEREEVDLSSHFTKKIVLKNPFVSAPMDAVTGADMAIAIAALGGIGVIHYNYMGSEEQTAIEEQVEEVKKVKWFEAAFIKNPVCLPETATVGDVYELKRKHGFFTAPIINSEGKLVGLVKHSDVRYIEDMSIPVNNDGVMTKRKELIVAHRRDTLDRMDIRAANRIIRQYNLETLPIVDDDDGIVALVTDRDLRKDKQFPLATKNENKQLRVFAAVESRLALAKPRIMALYEAECDGIVIDAGVAFKEQIDIARFCKENTDMEVIVGSIGSPSMLEEIVRAAADCVDAFRLNVGPGASCTTQDDLGVGSPPGSNVYKCAKRARELEPQYGFIPLIADGGIKKPADIVKALALGANTVMMGSLLAGLEESPVEEELIEGVKDDRISGSVLVKRFRGMGSIEAMKQRSAVRYAIEGEMIKVAEGKSMYVGYKGSAYKFIPWLAAAVRQSLLKQGFRNIRELQEKADIVPWYLTKE